MTQLMPQNEFFSALEAARQPKHGGGHAFSRSWAAGELSRAQLGEWAIQHFYYIDPIPQQFALLLLRTDGEPEGCGQRGDAHQTIHSRQQRSTDFPGRCDRGGSQG